MNYLTIVHEKVSEKLCPRSEKITGNGRERDELLAYGVSGAR